MITEFTCDCCGKTIKGVPSGYDEDLCVNCYNEEEIDYINSQIKTIKELMEVSQSKLDRLEAEKRKLLGIPHPPEPPTPPPNRILKTLF